MKTHEKNMWARLPAEAAWRRPARNPGQRGFTLVEMIIVIVLIGIISGMVAIFIRLPVKGFVDSAARADVADTGDTALRRIARDVHLALPNSLRVTADASGNQYLEMLLTRTGGRYLSADDNSTDTHILSFTNAATLAFDMVGPAPTGAQTIQVGDSVVVYNLGPGIAPADAYASPATNRAQITAIATSAATLPVTTIAMASNPFAAQNPPIPSPNHRFQVISGPVTYRWDSTALTLTRYWGYTIAETQPSSIAALTTGAASQALIATGVRCQTTYSPNMCFSYSTSTALSNALLEIDVTLQAQTTDTGGQSDTAVALFQQVHVDNTP
jgi:MSHA biogenesis protein MshO